MSSRCDPILYEDPQYILAGDRSPYLRNFTKVYLILQKYTIAVLHGCHVAQSAKLKKRGWRGGTFMATWRCVKKCGACCYLAERPEVEDYLSAEELKLYQSMVGEGGWCVNFDRTKRSCRIYPHRPRFCRVEPDVFQELYGVEPEQLNEFAIECCQDHIAEYYGDDSVELRRFNREVGVQLNCRQGSPD